MFLQKVVHDFAISPFLKKMKKREFDYYHNLWLTHYNEAGLQSNLVDIYMEYVDMLLKQSMPVIFDYDHLCLLFGVEKDYLRSVIHSPESHYRHFSIRKRSGGLRNITAPYYTLKLIQRWILDNILANVKIHRCAHGFRAEKSIISNVQMHVDQKELLKIDLKDFFPSIGIDRVIRVFQEIGYTKEVSFYLARICCYEEALPQGAPTSPALSNIISRHMDNRLYWMSRKLGLRYTRYADDMGLSGEHIDTAIIRYVSSIITECGFNLNQEKIRLYSENGNKILTGISLAGGKMRLPRKTRRLWGQEFYYITKYGLESHIIKNGNRNLHYYQTLRGRADFWRMVEPDNILVRNFLDYLDSNITKKSLGSEACDKVK